ncbi:MAG: sulfatase-like hydrolase/transferase [Chlamydiota bacterium]
MHEKKNDSQLYSLNYIYYGFYFLLFAGLQIFHVLLIDPSSDPERFIYAVYAGIESFVEVLCMASVSSLLLHRNWKWSHRLWILFLGVLLFCRIIDFLLVRLMDISIWHGMVFFFQETFANTLEILLATTIQPAIWILTLVISILLMVSGWFIFHFTQKIYQKRPILCSGKTLIGLFAISFSLLTFNDLILHFFESPESSVPYAKSLPWKRTLFAPEENKITVSNYLTPTSNQLSSDTLDSSLFSLERTPDIFLFVVETLREDFLTSEITPSIAQFKQDYASFEQTLSISNATHTSWFSIFYSTYPFYWSKYYNRTWTQGSPTLAILKKMGYQIHVYSSSHLNFYSMKRVLFGDTGQNADSIQEFQTDSTISPCQADEAAIRQLCHDINSSDKKGGRVFITFLDSPHFDYSWPEKTETVFTPIEEKMNYIKISYERNNLEKIQNRYKNSLHFVDGLFNEFKTTAKEKGIWEDSVVVFTADHGEEHNEYGCMFHASNLSPPQIQVPLYMKMGSSSGGLSLQKGNKASQIDIFPTLFHYIIGENSTASLFQGKSLFIPSSTSYLIGTRYNGSLTPYQFYIQNGNHRMIAEFCNSKNIFHCNRLKVLSIQNEVGESIPFSDSFVHSYFQEGLNALFGSENN